jgi:hypothetical protein
MLCNIGKYNGKATRQCSAIFKKIMTRRQDNALQFWKRLWLGDRTMLCNIRKYNGKGTGQCSAILENIMARQQDNALQYLKRL